MYEHTMTDDAANLTPFVIQHGLRARVLPVVASAQHRLVECSLKRHWGGGLTEDAVTEHHGGAHDCPAQNSAKSTWLNRCPNRSIMGEQSGSSKQYQDKDSQGPVA